MARRASGASPQPRGRPPGQQLKPPPASSRPSHERASELAAAHPQWLQIGTGCRWVWPQCGLCQGLLRPESCSASPTLHLYRLSCACPAPAKPMNLCFCWHTLFPASSQYLSSPMQ